MPSKSDFWTDFGGFWEPKWRQVGTKTNPKWLQDEQRNENFEVFGRKVRKSVWNYYSNVFLVFGSWENINFPQFGEQMGPSWESKSIKNRSQNEVSLWRHLGTDFSSILVGFGSQVGRENRAKIEEKLHRKYDAKPEPFRRRLGSVWGRFWPPKWNPKAPQHKGEFSLLSLRDPTLSRPRPEMAPRPHFGCFWYNFWMLLARIWFDFGSVFGQATQKDAKRCKKKSCDAFLYEQA